MISIIIPTLNEAEFLSVTLEEIRSNAMRHETIVVDGGSTDATLQMARVAGANVICVEKGRSAQMNAGAKIASGDILLFLHADTQIHPTSLSQSKMPCETRACLAVVSRGDSIPIHFFFVALAPSQL